MGYINPFRRLLREKGHAIGVNVYSREPVITEYLAQFYDYVWLDYEHSWFNKDCIIDHLIAARAGGAGRNGNIGCPVVIRVPSEFPPDMKPILDMGPAAVLFPMISTVEQAKRAIAACTYGPRGVRGFNPQRITFGYSVDWNDYLRNADEYTFKILQIESKTGVENIEEILALPGLDGICLGPADMSATVGKLMQFGDPEMQDLIHRFAKAVKKSGIPMMTAGPSDPESVSFWKNHGAKFFTAGSDMGFIFGQASAFAEKMREMVAK